MSLVLATAVMFGATAQVSVNINIGSQPDWGPVGYDRVDYYYMPDIETYYYVNDRRYIYYDGKKWKRSAALPAKYRTFNLYTTHKVVINDVNEPWINHTVYRDQYIVYKNKNDQKPLKGNRGKHKGWKKKH